MSTYDTQTKWTESNGTFMWFMCSRRPPRIPPLCDHYQFEQIGLDLGSPHDVNGKRNRENPCHQFVTNPYVIFTVSWFLVKVASASEHKHSFGKLCPGFRFIYNICSSLLGRNGWKTGGFFSPSVEGEDQSRLPRSILFERPDVGERDIDDRYVAWYGMIGMISLVPKVLNHIP